MRRIDWAVPGERIAPRLIPDDIIWLQQGTVAIPGQNPASWNWHWAKANFPSAWDVTTTGSGTVVSVIDSEFDTEHEDLKTKMRPGTNFDSGTPAYRTGDVRLTRVEEGHGTHVAGLVAAATGNRLGTSGACFDCTVIPYKISTFSTPGVGDAKFVADLTEALLASADDPSGVVNMSLGTRRDHPPLRAAVDAVRARGKVVVAAAGNDQQQNPGVNQYPAAYPGVVAVANTRPDDSINPSSSNGGFVDIAAPGTGVVSLWDSRLTAANTPQQFAPTHGTGYTNLTGTSMSAPIVAGLAAMIRTVRPDLTADEVEGVMASTAFDLGAQGRDQVFGAGRIDARRALDAAIAFQRPAPPAPPAPAAAPPAPAPPPAVKKTRSRIFMTAKLGKRRLKNNRLQTVRVKARIKVTGRTKPATRRVRVLVQRRVVVRRKAGGRVATAVQWKTFRKVRTNNKGRFGFVYRPKTRGRATIRVALGSTSTRARSAGPQLRLRVVAPKRRVST